MYTAETMTMTKKDEKLRIIKREQELYIDQLRLPMVNTVNFEFNLEIKEYIGGKKN